MWGVKLGYDNKVTYTMNQRIHMKLFSVLIILLVTYYVVVLLPNLDLTRNYRLLLISKHGHSSDKYLGGVIYLLSGVFFPTGVYEISLMCCLWECITLINRRVFMASYLYMSLQGTMVVM